MDALLFVRLGRIKRRIRAARIPGSFVHLRQLGVVIGSIPIAAPLPDVAGHVVEAVTVGRKLRYRREARIAVVGGVLDRKLSLPGVGHPLAVWTKFVAPDKGLARQATA